MKKTCPKCGKEMVEQPDWPGLWVCVDYKEPINFSPPYKYKCRGMRIEKKGVVNFEKAIEQVIAERN